MIIDYFPSINAIINVEDTEFHIINSSHLINDSIKLYVTYINSNTPLVLSQALQPLMRFNDKHIKSACNVLDNIRDGKEYRQKLLNS